MVMVMVKVRVRVKVTVKSYGKDYDKIVMVNITDRVTVMAMAV